MFPHRLFLVPLAVILALTAPAPGGALQLNGAGDFVTFPGTGIPSGSAAFTIEAWVNPDVHGDSTITFWGNEAGNQANGFRLKAGGQTRHYFWGNDHDTTSTGDISPNTSGPNSDGWHHLALSWNGAQTQWYWNGAPLEVPRSASGVSVAAANHRIGSRLNAEFFDGWIDEVRVWDKARDASEIAADYNRELIGSEANLVAYFDFEGDFGDRAGGDNGGTPAGNAAIDPAASAPVAGSGGPVIRSFTVTPTIGFEGENITLAWDVDATSITGALLVEILGPGGATIHSTATATDDLPTVIGDTSGAAQTFTYTLRASETGGAMISRQSTAGFDADPGRPFATPQTRSTVTTTPLPLTLAGSDPNSHPNPVLSFAIVTPPGGGSLTGTAPNLTYTANIGFTGTDSFTFLTNDGKYDSASATVTITVVPPPSPPTDLALSTTSIGEGIPLGGLVAALTTTDLNPGDTHSYALVAGAGSTDNGLFTIVGNQLRAVTSFAGLVGNTYSIRLRTTDSTGRSFAKAFVLSVVENADDIVINEIHYNPPDNTVRQEFIELFNPAEAQADLSGWRLSGAVSYILPAGTTIPAGGYLVIAEDPPTLTATLGANAIGPFTGSLNSDGETIRLRDQNDALVDEVDYRSGFPWPVASDGGGASIELINPALDNSLGSSWRASLPQNTSTGVLLPFGHNGWSWRPGSSEASDPVEDWRDASFVEDGSWTPGVPAPIGYGDVGEIVPATVVTGMQGSYHCLFLRNTFTIAPGEVPSALQLNYTVDDGLVIWINGVEVERKRFDSAELPTIDDFAQNQGAEGSYETKSVANPAALLVEGVNTIAVQVFNTTLGSSDLTFDLEVAPPGIGTVGPTPTPGAPNITFASNAAPNIRKVFHDPKQPTSSDPAVITALITDPDGVASVTLEYQVVVPGAYLPATLPHPVPNIPVNSPRPDNPAYNDPANWTTVTMLDDGSGGDALAGDDIYTVTLPVQAHRSLMRYRITVQDTLGLAARVPYPDDPSLNFAYFVYDGVPAYNGHPSATMQSLPVYHVITRNTDWDECVAYDSGQLAQFAGGANPARFYYNWNGTLVYDGEVYDNIRYRLRGANGRYYARNKRSMRFRLNKGNYFQARDQFGKKYDRKWRTLTTGKGFGNRLNLSFGLNEAVSMYLYNQLGVPASDTHWVHWRVIDDAAEAPDQWNGDFHGLYLILETYDVRFLESHDMEKGNLYKLINSTTDWQQQQRYQAAFAVDNGQDHDNIENNLDGGDSASYISAHVNLEKWYRNHALVESIRHYDYWPSANKNMVYYFEPDYLPENNNLGKLWILPWDVDATWGPSYNAGHDVVYNALFAAGGGGSDGNSTPELWPDYFNTIREVRDLVWQPDQIDGLLAEFASFLTPLEGADADRWKGAPASAGNYGGLNGAGLTSLAALVQDMHNFAFVGGSWPGGGEGAGGRAAYLDSRQGANGEGGQIPVTPTITYTGTAGYPTNGLAFATSRFSDPQGGGSFAALEWRVAEITDPTAPAHDPAERFKLEWNAAWESGELAPVTSSITIPTAAVRSGRTYRARVRHKDDTGRWSHWSAPVQFTTILPDISDYFAGLVISEVMYHPADPTAAEFAAGFTNDDCFEFIELRNVGPVSLDLTDLRFTKGVDFDFLGASSTSLAPGATVLVVANRAAFEMRYGTGHPVAGEWESTDVLDNGGERLKLSFGAGDGIRDFVYDDLAPWPTAPDGSGVSLTLVAPETVPNHSLPSSWRASYAAQGTPGLPEPSGGFAAWMAAQGALDPLALFADSPLSYLLAYAIGADLTLAPEATLPVITIVEVAGTDYPALRYRIRPDATDLDYEVELSPDLSGWQSGPAFTVQVGLPEDNRDGTETITVRSLQPISSLPVQFLRLRVSAGT